MIFRLLPVILLMAFTYSQPEERDIIIWKPARKLQWSDFKAPAPPNAPNAALTSSGILMKFATNGTSLIFEITCSFDRNNSWGRVKTPHILSHEQGHFDIAEVHARKLNKALSDYRFNAQSVNKDVNAIYGNVMEQLKQMQYEYDTQTDYSRNVPQQKVWLEKIDVYLESLDKYSD
jgi:hypothetical protein